jgi:hypothetical protein
MHLLSRVTGRNVELFGFGLSIWQKLKHFAKTGYGQICADIKGTLIENPRVGGSIPPLGTISF